MGDCCERFMLMGPLYFLFVCISTWGVGFIMVLIFLLIPEILVLCCCY